MSIAPTVQKYLAAENIKYDVMPHQPTASSTRTAEVCHVSGDCLAKGIVLRRDGGYMLAVLPASHHLRLSELRTRFGSDVDMAKEAEINQLFRDCALVLLRHKFLRPRTIARVLQYGHRDKSFTSASMIRMRMVAIESGMCRSGRKGGSSGSVTVGKGRFLEQSGGTRS